MLLSFSFVFRSFHCSSHSLNLVSFIISPLFLLFLILSSIILFILLSYPTICPFFLSLCSFSSPLPIISRALLPFVCRLSPYCHAPHPFHSSPSPPTHLSALLYFLFTCLSSSLPPPASHPSSFFYLQHFSSSILALISLSRPNVTLSLLSSPPLHITIDLSSSL